MSQAVFLLFTLSIVILAVLHGAALVFSLYWVYLWLDVPMHFLGGAVVALGYQSRFMLGKVAHRLSFGLPTTLLMVLVVGGLWELYEYIVGPILPGYAKDTVIDIVMDVLGGLVGYATARAVMRLES
jgi:hypothetical protein